MKISLASRFAEGDYPSRLFLVGEQYLSVAVIRFFGNFVSRYRLDSDLQHRVSKSDRARAQ